MRIFLAACGTLLLSAFVLLAGSGLLFGLLPLRARLDGFSDASIGLLGSCYFAGMLLGCIATPTLIRSVGHIRVYAACAALATTMPLSHLLLPEPLAWALLRGMTGFCFAAVYAIIESWLNERATNEIRGAVLAIYNIINFAAMAAGQQLMRLYDIDGFQLFALTAILISVAAIPVVLTPVTAPTPPESPHLRPVWLFRVSPAAFVGALFVGFANGAFWTLTPVYATANGLGAVGVADFVTATIVGASISLFPIGRYSDRIDRRVVLAGCSLLSALAAAGLVAFTLSGLASYWLLMGLSAIFGAAAMPIYAIAAAQGSDHARPEQLVEVSTGLLLIYTVGAVIGPALASLLMEYIGATGLFVWTAAVHLVLGIYATWRMRQRAPVRMAEREPFSPTPRTSPLAIELSPLVHEETRDH
ncbi:MAG: MFS transporter [Rhodobiaceae bacterium]|nr:MFS transporter [Rhodobiaceae bacterium]